MKKNTVIVENVLNSVIDEFKFTEEYANMCKALISAEEDFKAGIGNNRELLDKYMKLESFINENGFEYNNYCFCEGFRMGFKLCMDIFNL